jgi:hypothetical protein
LDFSKSNKLDSVSQAARVQRVHELLEESLKRADEQTSRIKVLNERMEAESQKTDMVLGHVKSGLGVL